MLQSYHRVIVVIIVILLMSLSKPDFEIHHHIMYRRYIVIHDFGMIYVSDYDIDDIDNII